MAKSDDVSSVPSRAEHPSTRDARAELPAPDVLAGGQTEGSVAPRETPAIPGVLDEDRHALLTAVLDRIVPARPELGGAGALGGTATLDRTLAASPPLRRLFLEGLTTIDLASATAATASPDRGFVALPPEEQDAALRAVEIDHPAFFAALVDHAYRGYYTHPAVRRLLGSAGRPPQPRGHHLPPFDLVLLDRQRRRLPFWRLAP
jgi:hypothetical protein